jgi:hypothetical protein
MRSQDSAFALLMEVYRQFQGNLIESDYEDRLRAAESLTDLKVKRQVIVLARQERDLRLRKMTGQMVNLDITYEHARQLDLRESGLVIPRYINPEQTQAKIRELTVLSPSVVDSDCCDESAQLIPASTMLFNARMP